MTDFFLLWIPLYHLVKIAFLVWCFLPSTRGALLIYHRLIEPILVKYESKIDLAGNKASQVAGRVARDVSEETQEELSAHKKDLVDGAVNNLLNNNNNTNSIKNNQEEPKKMA